MVWTFFVAQTIAMVCLAMLVLGLRDMYRLRSESKALVSFLPFLLIVVALIAWSFWLMIRIAPSLSP
jgi:hypothetical protein